jgi:hypothetical protein
MLNLLSAVQLVFYIALLAMLGQGVLHLLAGTNRHQNFFYSLLRIVSRSFTADVRRVVTRQVPDSLVPARTFFLLAVANGVVTFERMDLCFQTNSIGKTRCR